MKSLDEILQAYVNASYEELVEVAQRDVGNVIPFFREHLETDEDVFKTILGILSTAVAVDGKFTALEHKFFIDVLGGTLSYEDAKELVQNFYDEEIMTSLDGMVDECPAEVKSHLVSFICAAMSIDESISRDETSFIVKLIK